jgi:2-polyprenyl-6-methoxyphenol hydroxylase-like FAD-dependent oxidoreductase
MSQPMSEQTAVLVVGAGPVGLALACELFRHGLPCRIIDLTDGPTTQSRALGIQARTLEVLERVGIADEVLAEGLPLHGVTVISERKTVAHLRFDFAGLETHYPMIVALPQGDTERLLVARLEALGGRVERRTRLESFVQGTSGVSAKIKDEAGAVQKVHARWLVGCDGAKSTVRHGLGVGFEGVEYEETFVLADVRVAWDLSGDEMHMFAGPNGIVASFPMRNGRWRLIGIGESPGTDEPAAVVAFLQERIRAQGISYAVVSDPAWTSIFRVHRRLADDFRAGRCFLAGDAAHIHSPAGGQGMNTGIQDAFNLAWKLALVDSGASPDSMLDSYTPERRPVAAQVERGTDLMTRIALTRTPLLRSVRNRILSVVTQLDAFRSLASRGLSELAIGYRHSPIVAEDRANPLASLLPGPAHEFARGPHPGDRVPDVELPGSDDDGAIRLYDLLDAKGHTLLLFTGSHDRDDDAVRVVEDMVRSEFSRWIATYVVRAEDISCAGPVIQDPGGSLHERFGARAACLYLIRPDGYVGYRSQPPDAEKLRRYLGRIFKAGPEA